MSLNVSASQTLPGADPGFFVRGGPTFRKILTSTKKGREETEVFGCFSPFSAELWFSREWSFVQLQAASLHKHTEDMVVLI